MGRPPATPFYVPPRWEAALIAIAAIIAYLLLSGIIGEGRGNVAAAFLADFAMTIRFSWPLRKLRWFWAVVLALAAAHAGCFVLVDWSVAASWNGLTIMPFMAADITLLLSVIYAVYRAMYGAPVHLFLEPEHRYTENSD